MSKLLEQGRDACSYCNRGLHRLLFIHASCEELWNHISWTREPNSSKLVPWLWYLWLTPPPLPLLFQADKVSFDFQVPPSHCVSWTVFIYCCLWNRHHSTKVWQYEIQNLFWSLIWLLKTLSEQKMSFIKITKTKRKKKKYKECGNGCNHTK